jgi:hypothetical protein
MPRPQLARWFKLRLWLALLRAEYFVLVILYGRRVAEQILKERTEDAFRILEQGVQLLDWLDRRERERGDA